MSREDDIKWTKYMLSAFRQHLRELEQGRRERHVIISPASLIHLSIKRSSPKLEALIPKLCLKSFSLLG